MISLKCINIWTEKELPKEFKRAVQQFVRFAFGKIKFHQPELSQKILLNPEFLKQLASFRLINHQQKEPLLPYGIELEQEKKFLTVKKTSPFVYEASWLSGFYRQMFKVGLKTPAIVLTPRLIATFGSDGRYHLRYAYFSYPTVISLPGIVQAPAKDRSFYQLRFFDELLAKKFAEKHFKPEELSLALGNILYQAFFYFTTFSPFCSDKNCRLYNFHWHEELRNILKKNRFCPYHRQKIISLHTVFFDVPASGKFGKPF